MSIQEIILHDYKKAYGKNEPEHRKFKAFIQNTLTNDLNPYVDSLRKLDLYNMPGEHIEFNAGNDTRAIVYAHATRKGASEERYDAELQFGEVKHTFNMLQPKGDGLVLTSDNGIAVAEYFKDYNEFFILFDVLHTFDPIHQAMFKNVIRLWVEKMWKLKALESSWLHTSDKDSLTKRFTERMKQQVGRALAENKDKAQSYERSIDDYKKKIKAYYDNMIRLRNQIEMEEKNIDNVNLTLVRDLDLIVAHKKVSDLQIKDGLFTLFVPNVICHDDKDRHFILGNYQVQINLDNADVKFFGDNPRRSYWSTSDPHPHVDGRNGRACLGNISSTIAELSSRNEIYALALVCIDFLESANTGDPAGRNVVNWTACDEEGKALPDSEQHHDHDDDDDEDRCTCPRCEDRVPTDEVYTVYNHYSRTDGLSEERDVCDTCRGDHYSYWETIEEYVSDAYTEDDYFDQDGEAIQ